MAWGRGDKSPKVDGGGGSSSSSSIGIGSSNAKDASDSGGGDAHWFIQNEVVQFALMNTNEIKYMCMIGYTFLHGCKVFKKLENAEYSSAYKFISMILACTGGGILVPIFLNTIPVPLAIDAYPIAILISFGLHTYFPVLRDVVELSSIFKVSRVELSCVLYLFSKDWLVVVGFCCVYSMNIHQPDLNSMIMVVVVSITTSGGRVLFCFE